MSSLLVKPHGLAVNQGGTLLSVDAARAGWKDISFSVVRLMPDETWAATTGGDEVCLVVLQGRAALSSDGVDLGEVGARSSVFEGPCFAAYLPLGSDFTLRARGVVFEVAVARARASRRFGAKIIRPEQVELEERGEGNASRTIHHVLPPSFPADKLMVVEVFTPPGNWSSYPPHKHDRHEPPREHDLEEIYYYRIDRPGGFAIQRVYTDDGSLDETVTVTDGQLVLVPEGYHPVVAAPGFRVYYLNVLAGTGRSMAATDDPALAFVRAGWSKPQRPTS